MTTPSPLTEVSTPVAPPRPPMGALKPLSLIAAMTAIVLSSCSTATQHPTGFVNTSTGVTVSSTHSSEATPKAIRQVDSIPMLRDTTHLYDALGAKKLSVMLRDASESNTAPLDQDFRTFAPLR